MQTSTQALNDRKISITLEHSSDEIKKQIYKQILESERDNEGSSIYPVYPYKFYFLDDSKWIAVDNSTYCCWVEEFDTLDQAKHWLINESYHPY
jgi:hypothetical protein